MSEAEGFGGQAAHLVKPEIEKRTMRKINVRLLPMFAAMFLVNSLDRGNVSFAALTMNSDIGIGPTMFAWGAGAFFLTYFLFEVPSNVALARFGARIWMARIMVSWGLASAAMALVVGAKSFVFVRLLLGAAEAGLVPGMVLYITFWFPRRYRATAVAWLFISAPASYAIASALSVPILQMDGMGGLTGWQWMFIIEALPSIFLAVIVLVYLKDSPDKAAWLTAEEKLWLDGEIRRDSTPAPVHHAGTAASLFNTRVALLALIYFMRTTSLYGINLFLPQIIKAMGMSNTQVGFYGTIPYLAATVGSMVWAASSDRTGERYWHTSTAILSGAAGLVLAGLFSSPWLAMAALSVAAIGTYSQAVCFWSLPPLILAAGTASVGIAAINAIGNLGGFCGPYIVALAVQATGGFGIGLYVLAGCAALSGILTIYLQTLGWDRKTAPTTLNATA